MLRLVRGVDGGESSMKTRMNEVSENEFGGHNFFIMYACMALEHFSELLCVFKTH